VSRHSRAIQLSALVVATGIATLPAGAQLRPLEPIPWPLVTTGKTIAAAIGASRLADQRASLAGETGVLWELANFSLDWRTGRVVIEAAGTGQRLFTAKSHFAERLSDVEPDDGTRHDSGDYRISTTVRLSPPASRVTAAVRFGTRLPTTDNTTGLDRDAIDFFANVGGATSRGRLAVSAEAGLGVHTTREQQFEQDDLFLYAFRAEYHGAALVPSVIALGQKHGTAHSAIRGVEDLGEIRFGLRSGTSRWIRGEIVKGYETFSPSTGVIVTAGFIH
jgi:hypothetical protein